VKEVVFHPMAEAEYLVSARFYESASEGLGAEFLTQVEDTVSRASADPGIGTPQGRWVRRQLVRRFPFAVVYREEPTRIFILAVMHLRRRPGYWKSRTTS